MSAWSDYKVTHDEADLATYRHECESDDRAYRDGLYVYDEDEDEEE